MIPAAKAWNTYRFCLKLDGWGGWRRWKELLKTTRKVNDKFRNTEHIATWWIQLIWADSQYIANNSFQVTKIKPLINNSKFLRINHNVTTWILNHEVYKSRHYGSYYSLSGFSSSLWLLSQYRKLGTPKSASLHVHLLSTTQLELFKFPW